MKLLLILAFLTLVAFNGFSQVPVEIDHRSRLGEYEQAQSEFLYQKDIVKSLKQKAKRSDVELADTVDRINKKKGQRKINRARLDQISVIIPESTQKIKELNNKKVALSSKTADLTAAEAKAVSVLKKKQTKLATLEPKVKEYKDKVLVVDKKIKDSKNQKITKKNKLKETNSSIQTKKTKVQTLKTGIESLKTQKTKAEQVLSTLEPTDPRAKKIQIRIARLEKAIVNNKTKIKTTNTSIKSLEKTVTDLSSAIKGLNSKITALESEKSSIISSAGTLYQKYEAVKTAVETAKKDKQIASTKLKANKDKIIEITATITKKQNSMANLVLEQKQTKAMQMKLKSQIARLSAQADEQSEINARVWARFDRAKQKSMRLNRKAARFYVIYEETKSRFDVYMNAAIHTGATQAKVLAENEAASKGENLGDINGVEEAIALGKEIGLLKGFFNGLEDGMIKGKTEGYNAGFNLPSNYEKGYQLGLKAGVIQANQDAQTEDYPKGRSQKQKELLARVLDGSPLKSSSFVASSVENVSGAYNDHFTKSSTVSASSSDPIISLIEQVQSEIAKVQTQINQLVDNPVSGIQIEIPNRLNELSCPSSYPANYSEFIVACENSFVTTFNNTYQAVFSEEYNASYLQNFEQKIQDQVSVFGGERFNEGYDKAYGPTFSKYKLIGASDAQNKGYNDGHKKSYSESIKQARALAFKRGQTDEKEYFDTHAVIKIMKTGLVSAEGKFIPKAKVQLAVEIGNYGQIGANAGELKIEVVSENQGLIFDTKTAEVKAIPAVAKISNSSILTAVVGDDVQPGSVLKVKVNVLLNNQIVDSKIISIAGQSDFKATMVITGNQSPKFRLFSNKANMKVKITNLSRTKLTSSLSVKMRASHRDIKITNSTKSIGALTEGQSVEVGFEYKGKKKLKRKKITLTFDTIYQGKIIKTESIMIKPI